jgi:3-phosphoshikimate 1-carboxyvinyltransferase
MKAIPALSSLSAHVSVPPSKSYTARALLLATMTEGETTVRNALDCDDARYMYEAIRKIGFTTSGSFRDGLTIGPRLSMSADEVEIFVGNAGTAMRFLTGFFAFTPGRFVLTGESRMLERPIGDLVEALLAIGGEVEYVDREGWPPLRIRGKKARGGFMASIEGGISSQFVSALMMVGAGLPDGMVVRVGELSSRPYVEMTASIIEAFGSNVEEIEPRVYHVQGSKLALDEYVVEGDWSSASYWLAAAAVLGGDVALTGLERSSAQGDRRFVEILEAMGCQAAWTGDDLRLTAPDRLAGGTFDCNETPDIVPTLAAIAPFASSPVEITNVGHLRVKESDRIDSVAGELTKLGARVTTTADSMRVEPGYGSGDVSIDPHDDHRLAMAFAIAGLRRGGISIENERVVAKSYPRFWKTLDEVVAARSPA